LVPTVSLGIQGGVLTAQCDAAANTVTVDHVVQGGKGFAEINGHLFADTSYSSIRIIGGAGGTTTNVHSNVKPLTVFGDSNKDVVNLGDTSNKLQGIRGAVLVEDEKGFTSALNINDQGDSATHTVTLSTVLRAGDTSLGQLSGLGAAAIQWDYHDTHAMHLHLGVGASSVNVLGTGTTTNIFNSAAASILVGNGGTIAGIQGALNLENESGAKDSVTLFDLKDTATHTATVSTIARTGNSSLGAVNGLGSAQITWDYKDTLEAILELGTGTRTVNVLGTGPLTTNISIIAPHATVNVGNGNVAANIQGVLNLLTEASGAAVNILDQNDTQGQNAVLSAFPRLHQSTLGQLSRLGSSSITWDYLGTGSVSIVGGRGANTFNILGTVVPTRLETNGTATINVGQGSIAGIQGNLILESNSGRTNTVSIFSQNDGPKTQAFLDSGDGGDSSSGVGNFFVAGVSSIIYWDNADTSAVNLDLGSEFVQVRKTVVTTNIINNGNATVSVGAPTTLAGIQGALNLENLGGSDVVSIFDQADTTSRSVTLDTIPGNLGRITALSAPITFSNDEVSQVFLELGTATSTVNVNGIGTGTTIINGGNASVFVGTGTLAAIQGSLTLDNEAAKDTIFIDDSEDVTQTFNMIAIPGVGEETGHTFGRVFGTAMTGNITWDNADTSGVTLFGSNAGNVYNIADTGVATTIDGGGNATINVGDNNNSLAGIHGALNLENLGSSSTLSVFDQGDTTSPSVTLDTLAGNVGQITGLSAPITFQNNEASELDLNLGTATSTVNVGATGTRTIITNSANATVFVGTGTLTAIQGFLGLSNVNGFDTVIIDDSEDPTGQTFGLISFPGTGPEGATTFGQVFGTANTGFITWDNAETNSVTLLGGSGGNTFNIFETGVATTIDGGSGANAFNVHPSGTTGGLGANIVGPLTLHGGGNAGTGLNLNDKDDPNSETFNFAISPAGTGVLGLGSTPSFDLIFDGMTAFVDLATNGVSTVNDPSGTVNFQ
jgi:hypothetical protein